MKNITAKKIVIIISAVLFLILAKLSWAYITNENFISRYDRGVYDVKDVQGLFFINLPEPCVAHYNRGNIHYQREDFDAAIDGYEKALRFNPSGEREVSIRINLALARLGRLRNDVPQDTDEILERLKDARTGLYINEVCHEFDDYGRSETAKELEQEIRRMEERLQEPPDDPDENGDDDDKDKDKDKKDDEKQAKEQEELKKQLEEQRKKAAEERADDLDHDIMDWEYYDGKVW